MPEDWDIRYGQLDSGEGWSEWDRESSDSHIHIEWDDYPVTVCGVSAQVRNRLYLHVYKGHPDDSLPVELDRDDARRLALVLLKWVGDDA